MEQWLERWKVDLRFRVQIPLLPFFAFISSANAGLPQMRKTEFFWTKKAPPFFEK